MNLRLVITVHQFHHLSPNGSKWYFNMLLKKLFGMRKEITLQQWQIISKQQVRWWFIRCLALILLAHFLNQKVLYKLSVSILRSLISFCVLINKYFNIIYKNILLLLNIKVELNGFQVYLFMKVVTILF